MPTAVARRRGPRPRWAGFTLIAVMAALGVAGVVAVAALAVLLTGGGNKSVPAEPLMVELFEMAYLPEEIVVPADTPTRLLLRNSGSLQHDFSVDALRVSPDVRPGEERLLEFTAPAGRYEVYCTFPGHRAAGMTAVLIAEPHGR